MKTHIYIYISILFMLMFSACGKKTDREYEQGKFRKIPLCT